MPAPNAAPEAAGLNMTEQPVTDRKSPPRRQDVERIPDDKLRDALWNRQARRCANPYCDSENLRKVDLQLDHQIPRIQRRRRRSPQPNRPVRQLERPQGNAKAWSRFLDVGRAKQLTSHSIERVTAPHTHVGDFSLFGCCNRRAPPLRQRSQLAVLFDFCASDALQLSLAILLCSESDDVGQLRSADIPLSRVDSLVLI